METTNENLPEKSNIDVVNERMEAAHAAQEKDAQSAGREEIQNTTIPDVPPQTTDDLAAHLSAPEPNDETRDNLLSELSARVDAMEQNLANFYEGAHAYIVDEFAKLGGSHPDVVKAVNYVRNLMHPSQWDKL